MALPPFQRIVTPDQDLSQVQNNVSRQFNALSTQPLATGTVLKSVALVIGDNTVYHGLGAPLQGWFPTRIRGVNATFYDNQDTNATPSQTLIINSSAVVIVDLLVF